MIGRTVRLKGQGTRLSTYIVGRKIFRTPQGVKFLTHTVHDLIHAVVYIIVAENLTFRWTIMQLSLLAIAYTIFIKFHIERVLIYGNTGQAGKPTDR